MRARPPAEDDDDWTVYSFRTTPMMTDEEFARWWKGVRARDWRIYAIAVVAGLLLLLGAVLQARSAAGLG